MAHCERSNLIIVSFTQAHSTHDHKINNAFYYFIILHAAHVVLTATREGPQEEHIRYLHFELVINNPTVLVVLPVASHYYYSPYSYRCT